MTCERPAGRPSKLVVTPSILVYKRADTHTRTQKERHNDCRNSFVRKQISNISTVNLIGCRAFIRREGERERDATYLSVEWDRCDRFSGLDSRA